MVKKKFFYFILLLLSLLILTHVVNAGECEYGTVRAWYSKDKINWQNATVDNAKVMRGEPFFIKTNVYAKTDLTSIDIKIWETGENNPEDSTFELIDGSSCFFSYYDIYPVSKNDTFTLIWEFRVKPDTEWVNGNAPLNIYAQFDKDPYDNKEIDFTIVNLFIQDSIWEDDSAIKLFEDNDLQMFHENDKPAESTQKLDNILLFLLLIFCFVFIILINIKKKF